MAPPPPGRGLMGPERETWGSGNLFRADSALVLSERCFPDFDLK